MTESFAPNDGKLRRYRARTLCPQELLALSDHFAAYPEQRPSWFAGSGWLDGTPSPPFDKLGVPVGYAELVAKLDGVADPVKREILEARLANDPWSTDYLADLAAFRKEMAARPAKVHGPEPVPVGKDNRSAIAVGRFLRLSGLLAAFVLLAAVVLPGAFVRLRRLIVRLRPAWIAALRDDRVKSSRRPRAQRARKGKDLAPRRRA